MHNQPLSEAQLNACENTLDDILTNLNAIELEIDRKEDIRLIAGIRSRLARFTKDLT